MIQQDIGAHARRRQGHKVEAGGVKSTCKSHEQRTRSLRWRRQGHGIEAEGLDASHSTLLHKL